MMRRSLHNRPLRSVLANRKLFQGGGMVGMGNSMAMANMQPAGILASSPNLINAVANDAINPQGGPTLSMADGGIAKFREGGANDLRRQVQYALSIKPDEMYETPGGLHTSNEEVLTLLQRLDPNNPIYPDVVNAAKERGLPIPKPHIQVAEAPEQLTRPEADSPTPKKKNVPARVMPQERMPYNEMAHRAVSPELLSEQLLTEGEIEPAIAPEPEALSRSSTLPDLIQAYEEGPVRRSHELERAVQLKKRALEALGSNPGTTLVGEAVDWFTMSANARAAEALEQDKAEIAWNAERNRIGDIPAEHWLRESGASEATIKHYSPEGEGLPLGYQSFFKNYWSPEEEKTDADIDVGTLGLGEEAAIAAQPAEEIISPDKEELPADLTDADIDVGTKGLGEDAALVGRPGGEEQYAPRGGSQANMKAARVAYEIQEREKSLVSLKEWVSSTGESPDNPNIPATVVNQTVDDVFRDALTAARGESFDAKKMAEEIDVLLPRTKDDPQMEGLLLLMLGASIAAGKDRNAWVNVGQGIQQALPAMMNFKAAQKEKEREREMTIAKLAIETKLSREGDQRTLIRGIEAEQRGAKIGILKEQRAQQAEIDKENRTRKNYITIKPSLVDNKVMDPNAEEGSFVVPKLMSWPALTDMEARRLQSAGVPIVEVKPATVSLDDLSGEPGELTLKQLNELGGTPKELKIFAFGRDEGTTISFIPADIAGIRSGLMPEDILTPGNWNSVYHAWSSRRAPLTSLSDRILKLANRDDLKRLTGIGGFKERIGDALVGFGGGEGELARFGRALIGGDLSQTRQFEIEARLILAEIAPILLGESGKTISDADRARVARTLGFSVDVNINRDTGQTMYTVTGFDAAIMATNPSVIYKALDELNDSIDRAVIKVDNEAMRIATRFGRSADLAPADISKVEESKKQIEKRKGKDFFKYDLTT